MPKTKRDILTYNSWRSLRARCKDAKNPGYKNYGGRGICMDSSWEEYEVFRKDMGLRPNKMYTLDRINNELGYFKSNCRWATKKEQALNRRSNKKLSFKGQIRTVSEWCELLKLNVKNVYARLSLGWSTQDALSLPVKYARYVTYEGKTKTLNEWEKEYNLGGKTLSRRLAKGWSFARALKTPTKRK